MQATRETGAVAERDGMDRTDRRSAAAFSDRRFGLRFTLAAAMGGPAAVVAVAVLAALGQGFRSNAARVVEIAAEQVVASLAARIDQHMVPAVEQVMFVAESIESAPLRVDLRTVLPDLLTQSLVALPQIRFVTVIDPDNRGMTARREADGGIRIGNTDPGDDARFEGDEALVALPHGLSWGALGLREGQTTIQLSRPLRRGEDFIGLVTASIAVPELSPQTQALGDQFPVVFRGFHAVPFALYGRDHVLAHPALAGDGADRSAAQPVVPLARLGDPVLLAAGRDLTAPGPDQGAPETMRLSTGGGRYQVAYRWLDQYGATPWAVGVWTDAPGAGAVLASLWGAILIAFAAVAAAAAAGGLLGARITAGQRSTSGTP